MKQWTTDRKIEFLEWYIQLPLHPRKSHFNCFCIRIDQFLGTYIREEYVPQFLPEVKKRQTTVTEHLFWFHDDQERKICAEHVLAELKAKKEVQP